jgi:hypothetical protein
MLRHGQATQGLFYSSKKDGKKFQRNNINSKNHKNKKSSKRVKFSPFTTPEPIIH